MTTVSLWLGEIAMGIGTLAFFAAGIRARRDDRHHYLTSASICLIATASYLALALGSTHVVLSDGHAIDVARYVDWLFTTPLLLFGTAVIGLRSHSVDKTTINAAIVADAFMIVTGFAGGVAVDATRWVWYAFSCIGFVAVLVLLWRPLRVAAAAAGRERPYVRLIAILSFLWVQYPIVWLLGEEGVRAIGSGPETVWYTVLDVLAKVAFGAASLAAVRALPSAVEAGGAILEARAERPGPTPVR